ncbi:MAG TPA: ABC transporter substrate-binding protein [Anaerolineae bacterium]|nr:ABC transporter substrate-binding protein [Anaerolineae bacterium]
MDSPGQSVTGDEWGRRIGRRWQWIVFVLLLMAAAAMIWRSVHEPEDRVWSRIQGSGIWRVGMDPSFPPFETLDATGAPVGFDVDLARAIAAGWGVEVTIEGIGFDGLLPSLWANKADAVISALPTDPRLSRDVSYSIPYFEAGLLLVVVRGETDINGPDDLRQRRLAVEWGSEGDVQGRVLRRRLTDMLLLPLPLPEDALAAIVSGEADAALVDAVTLRQSAAGQSGLVAVGDPVVSVPYVIALPVDAPRLLQEVNDALVRLRKSGDLQRLEATWLGQ